MGKKFNKKNYGKIIKKENLVLIFLFHFSREI